MEHAASVPGLVGAGPRGGRQELERRLGVNVPSGWWPTAPMLKAFEAAGFAWAQVHTPPRVVLRQRGIARRHAVALRSVLDAGGLRLVLHGPDDLRAGEAEHDDALDALLEYAAVTGAEYVAYHGANHPVVDGGAAAAAVAERLAREEESLARRAPRLESLGLRLAVENLAPVWPGPPRLCHSPRFVREFVARLGSPNIGMLFDAGHANIEAGLTGADVGAMLAAVADSVVLFHLHDNLGARRGPGLTGRDPLRLDLHLAPGAGRLPWAALARALCDHSAPLMMEVHPPHRPEPLALATVTTELLVRDRRGVSSARAALPAPDGRPRPTVPLG